jgi:hypothetical protein
LEQNQLDKAFGIAILVLGVDRTEYDYSSEKLRHLPPCNNCKMMFNQISGQGRLAFVVNKNFSIAAW